MHSSGGVAVADRPATLTHLCTISGFEVWLLPRERHPGAEDRLVHDALQLERTTLQLLECPDTEIDADIDETLDDSSFALIFEPASAECEEPRMVGAVRFMIGLPADVKTIREVDRLSSGPRHRIRHPAMTRGVKVVDVMSLALSLDVAMRPADLADVLLGACRCIGGAVQSTGRASYVTAHLHWRCRRHAERIGYPCDPLVAADHPASDDFVPVIASLATHDRLVRSAAARTHLAEIRSEYLRVWATADSLGTDGW